MSDLTSQTWPPKWFQPQNAVFATKQSHESQIGNEPGPLSSHSNICPAGTQESGNYMTTTLKGNTNICPLINTTPDIEETMVRDQLNNELYLPLTSTVVLERKEVMLYVHLDFENNLTIDALVYLRAFVSATT